MALNYDYDETSETWPFFVLTVALMVLIPLTLWQLAWILRGSDHKKDNNVQENEENMELLNDSYTLNEIKKFRHKFLKGRSNKVFNRWNLVIIIGWCLVVFLIHRINGNDAITESTSGLFDPYELLGISTRATDKEIKSAYRKLSVKFHPDKLSKDLSESERNILEESYVQITKAYESLTDELTKENYLKYGHPDGPQSVSHGIALPSFLIDTTSSPLLVAVYLLCFVFVLPWIVSKWWTKTRTYTKKGVHTLTASYFVDRLVNYKPSEVITINLIINWLSNAQEFKDIYPELTSEDFERLLHDHLNRRDSGEQNDIKYRIVALCHTILYGLLDVTCAFRNTDATTMTLNTFKCIVQAVPSINDAEIYQLPNVDKETFENGSVDDIHTLGKLFTYPDDKIGKILGIKDSKKLEETLQVASNIPILKLLSAEFVVPGEDCVTPLSIAHISIKVLVRSAKHKVIPVNKFPAERFEESKEFEDLKDPFAKQEQQPLLPYSFAPLFPTKRRNAWCCMVILQKDNKIIQNPLVIQKLSLKNLKNEFGKLDVKDFDKDFNPEDWEIGTIKIPIGQQAPAENGHYFFRIVIKSTDYFGSDLDLTMDMNVRDPPKVEEDETSYSDDEDENEDEEDLDDDEEDESDFTDIDTDTEVEEDAIDEK